MKYKVEVVWTEYKGCTESTFYCESYQHNPKANTLYLYDTEDELMLIICLDHAKTCEFKEMKRMGF